MNASDTLTEAARKQFHADADAAHAVCVAAQTAAKKAYRSTKVTDATKATYRTAHHAARQAYRATRAAAYATLIATVKGN